MSLPTLCRFAFAAAIPALVVACAVETAPTENGGGGGGWGPSGAVAIDAGTASGAPSEYPILALVDTNLTMTAAPGQGVGVFAEYAAGGQWTVWWTCDSLVDTANPPCQFDVKISVESGSISAPTTNGFAVTDTFTSSATQIEGVTTTSTGSDGVTFQTAPGAVITLSATVGGQYDGRFLFFVEGGKVDDGYSGTVTDPINLQGSTP
jgi:hypothetical protein